MKYLLLIVLLFSFIAANGQNIRRVLLFATDTTNVDLKTQQDFLRSDTAGVEGRDIWIALFTNPKVFRGMFEHYGVGKTRFLIILIDKDGTEKLRSEKPVPIKDLFDLIDHPSNSPTGMRNDRK
jgi:hypothetical protein